MCGIIGMYMPGKEFNNTSAHKTFTDLLVIDSLRGLDSTGVCAVPIINKKKEDNESPIIYKRPTGASNFIGHKFYQNLISPINYYNVLLGHNRAATIGRVSNKNCHPFRSEHIYLVHNGSLLNYKKFQVQCETDSECIANLMAKEGEKETLEQLEGAYALVWYNANDNSLNMARNKERPLSFIWTKNKKFMFYGSELPMIQWAMTRNNLQYEGGGYEVNPGFHLKWYIGQEEWEQYEFTIKKSVFYTTNPYAGYHKYYSRGLNKTRKEGGKSPQKNFSEPEKLRVQSNKDHKRAKKLEEVGLDYGELIPFDPVESYSATGGGNKIFGEMLKVPFYSVVVKNTPLNEIGNSYVLWARAYDVYTKKNKIIVEVKNVVRVPYNYHVENFDEEDEGDTKTSFDSKVMVKGPTGIYIPANEWITLVQDGCSSCSQPIPLNEANEVVWTEAGHPICCECVEDYKKLNPDLPLPGTTATMVH